MTSENLSAVHSLDKYNQLIAEVAKQNLKNFSLNKLIEQKWVTRNFKTGLVFNNNITPDGELKVFLKHLRNQVEKKHPYLKTSLTINEEPIFLNVPKSVSGLVICKMVNEDRALTRYILKLNRIFSRERLPFIIELYSSDASCSVYRLRRVTGPVINFYKLFMYLDEALKITSTLHRKMYFPNPEIQKLFATRPNPVKTKPTPTPLKKRTSTGNVFVAQTVQG